MFQLGFSPSSQSCCLGKKLRRFLREHPLNILPQVRETSVLCLRDLTQNMSKYLLVHNAPKHWQQHINEIKRVKEENKYGRLFLKSGCHLRGILLATQILA